MHRILIILLFTSLFSPALLASLASELRYAIEINNAKEVKRVVILLNKPQAEKVDDARWLQFAFNKRRYKIAELMLKNGFDASAVDRFGKPLIVEMSGDPQSKPVELLLKYGANPDARRIVFKGTTLQMAKETALQTAVRLHYLHHVYPLVDAGANLDLRAGNQGDTVLAQLVRFGHQKEIRYVLEHGADANMLFGENGNRKTVLGQAAWDGRQEIVQLLLAYKANPNAGEAYGKPIAAALTSHHLSLIEKIVAAGGDINSRDKNGDTYLMTASRFGRLSEVKLLIGLAAKVNISNKDGVTPLMAAAKAGYLAISKILLAQNGDKNLKSKDGKTAIDYARENYHTNISKLLEK